MRKQINFSNLRKMIKEAIEKHFLNTNVGAFNGKRYLTEANKIEFLNTNVGAFNGKRYLAEAIKYNKRKVLYSSFLNEGIDFEPSEKEKGGIIVFSTDVNAKKMSENEIVNFLKQKIQTISNRLKSTSKIDKIANDNELEGWTIGHYLDGRYTAKNGKTYGENSISVELIGVDFDKLIKIGEELCVSFHQESVLVKDYSSGRILFINADLNS